VVQGCTVNEPAVAHRYAVNEPKDGEDGDDKPPTILLNLLALGSVPLKTPFDCIIMKNASVFPRKASRIAGPVLLLPPVFARFI